MKTVIHVIPIIPIWFYQKLHFESTFVFGMGFLWWERRVKRWLIGIKNCEQFWYILWRRESNPKNENNCIPKFELSTLRGNAIKQGKCAQGQPEFLHQHKHQHLLLTVYIYKHLLRKGKSVGVEAVAGGSTSNYQKLWNHWSLRKESISCWFYLETWSSFLGLYKLALLWVTPMHEVFE